MFTSFRRALMALVILLLTISSLQIRSAYAALSNCSADASPNQINTNSASEIQFAVQNTAVDTIQWIRVTRPSNDFILSNTTVNGWTDATASDTVTLSGGSLEPGATLYFSINTHADSNETSSAWTIQASDDSGGANPVSCYGSHSLGSITPPAQPPVISNIQLSSLTSSSISISWDTDQATQSQINYGKTDSYGLSTRLESSQFTSHSAKLTKLSSNTGYHFQIFADSGNGQPSYSSDNTFLTPEETVSAPTSSNLPPTLTIDTSDKIPPTIRLLKVPATRTVKTSPTIAGEAADDKAVQLVEYSTDTGKNWLPAESSAGWGSKKVNFSFTPTNLDDGNYSILARAIDAGGNTAVTSAVDVVIDRLPPLVGGNLISVGPQVLEPDPSGLIKTIVGVDQKITLSAVGGATNITLNATSASGAPKSFTLSRSQDTGLWSGILSFEKPGTYRLTANSVDGAGNKASRELNDVEAAGAAKVVKAGSNQTVDAKVTAYYLEPDSNSWVSWDGGPYNQTNPQKTGPSGQFNLFLPTGRYYLRASAKGYHNMTSQIFELKQPMPISTTLSMRPAGLRLGPLSLSLPKFSAQKLSFNMTAKKAANDILGKNAPNFSLSKTDGGRLNAVDLLGRPTVLSFMATWSPATPEQLSAMSKLQSDKDINVMPVGLQENAGKLRTYSEMSGYSVSWLADPDSTLSASFKPQSLPMHYFIDRTGIIRQIVSGVLTKQEILNGLSNL